MEYMIVQYSEFFMPNNVEEVSKPPHRLQFGRALPAAASVVRNKCRMPAVAQYSHVLHDRVHHYRPPRLAQLSTLHPGASSRPCSHRLPLHSILALIA